METEQAITKRKKIIVPLFFLILIFSSLIFVKLLLNRMNSYIAENGKSSMGAVIEQIQQTYDIQVNGYYSQLHLLEDSLIQEGVRSIELDKNKKYYVRVRAYKWDDGEKVFGKWSKIKKITVKGKANVKHVTIKFWESSSMSEQNLLQYNYLKSLYEITFYQKLII